MSSQAGLGLERNGALDWLRAAAVSLVMLYHGNWAFKGLGIFAGLGWVGVDLFFVLSGLLVTQAWLRTPTWSAYLRRRAWRVIPAYYVTLLLAGCLVLLFSTGSHQILRIYSREAAFGFIYLSSLLPNLLLGPIWSLSVEVHFWLMLPLLVAGITRFSRRHPLKTLGGLFCLPILARVALLHYFPEAVGPWAFPDLAHLSGAFGEHIYTNTFAHMDAFLVGVWITVQGDSLKLRRPTVVASLVIGAVTLVLSVPFKTYAPRPLPMVLFQFTGLAIGFGMLTALCWTHGKGLVAPSVVCWLSERVYSLYLGQALFFFVLSPVIVGSRHVGIIAQILILGSYIALSCAAGRLLYQWIEVPFRSGGILSTCWGQKKPLAGERGAGPGTPPKQEFQGQD